MIIAPSILAMDFITIKDELEKFANNKIEWIHYDVMDNHFVPNLSFGPHILANIKKHFNFKIDAHMMIEIKDGFDFNQYFQPYIKAGVDLLTIHCEAFIEKEINEVFKILEANNIKKSIAVNPNTNIEKILSFLPKVDNVLIMSVEPGFGGQAFIERVLTKASFLKDYKKANNLNFTIQIDGGINDQTFKKALKAGVESFVVGSYLTNQEDFEKRLNGLINEK